MAKMFPRASNPRRRITQFPFFSLPRGCSRLPRTNSPVVGHVEDIPPFPPKSQKKRSGVIVMLCSDRRRGTHNVHVVIDDDDGVVAVVMMVEVRGSGDAIDFTPPERRVRAPKDQLLRECSRATFFGHRRRKKAETFAGMEEERWGSLIRLSAELECSWA